MPSEVKTLIIYAHPEAQESVANRRLLKEIAPLAHVTIHDLYASYPDFFINIADEQQRLRSNSVIVFQYPLYTYSCPALLKEWFDRVLTRGFVADNSELAGKYWRSVITTGEPEAAYRASGLNRYPMSDIIRPFELTAQTCQMHWLTPMLIYHARRQPPHAMQSYAEAYTAWLQDPIPEEFS